MRTSICVLFYCVCLTIVCAQRDNTNGRVLLEATIRISAKTPIELSGNRDERFLTFHVHGDTIAIALYQDRSLCNLHHIIGIIFNDVKGEFFAFYDLDLAPPYYVIARGTNVADDVRLYMTSHRDRIQIAKRMLGRLIELAQWWPDLETSFTLYVDSDSVYPAHWHMFEVYGSSTFPRK